MGELLIFRKGQTPPMPKFTYTGEYKVTTGKNWSIRFLSSGVFTLIDCEPIVDVFLVGGGAAGINNYVPNDPDFSGIIDDTKGNNGGGSGYTVTRHGVRLKNGEPYQIDIGEGGIGYSSRLGFSDGDIVLSESHNGGYTSAFSFKAYGGTDDDGGSGGGVSDVEDSGNGGYDGNDAGGNGQGRTTRAFGEPKGELFAGGGAGTYDTHIGDGGLGGGGGVVYHYQPNGELKSEVVFDGQPNTGSGGCGALKGYNDGRSGNGGSGIVIIRKAI